MPRPGSHELATVWLLANFTGMFSLGSLITLLVSASLYDLPLLLLLPLLLSWMRTATPRDLQYPLPSHGEGAHGCTSTAGR